MEKGLSRPQFEQLVADVLVVLAHHGFRRLPSDGIERYFREDFDWHSILVPMVRMPFPSPTQEVTPRLLDLMTIECAKVYAKHGISGVRFNEGLNGVRTVVEELLKHWGYKVRFGTNHTLWCCYGSWVELATLCGLAPDHIMSAQQDHFEHFHEGRGVYYESEASSGRCCPTSARVSNE